MASPACTFCETNEGVYMGTNLADGDTQVACATCLPPFAIGMATAIIGQMDPDAREAYADALEGLYATDANRKPPEPPPAPSKPSRGKRKPAAEPADAPEVLMEVELDPACPSCGGYKASTDGDKATCLTCGTVLAPDYATP